MNYFVEGLQGSGKSTLAAALAARHPEYRAIREGEYSPVELAWCAYVNRAQYDAILLLLDGMYDGDTSLRIEVSNYAEYDDFMAVYLECRGDGFLVELDFPMEEYDWAYPLVLAAELGTEQTEQLLRDLLLDAAGTGRNETVSRCFRRVPALRYGERGTKKDEKD